MMPKKLWIWNLVLMFLPLVITLMILPHLPNQIPAHYGFDGQVDRGGSKYETLIVPLLAVITGGILLLVAKFAGKAEDGGQNNRRVTLLGSIIALLVFNAMTLYFLYTDMAPENLAARRTSVCQMAKTARCEVVPVDMGMAGTPVPGVVPRRIAAGTADFTQGPAMTRAEALQAIAAGIALVQAQKRSGVQLLATGEMGIGNTTTSSAVASVLLRRPPAALTGRGAGLSDEGLQRKIAAIERGIAVNSPAAADPLGVLAALGGFDIAGLCGVFLGGALESIPIVMDGFISGVAALCAVRLCPAAAKAVFASHASSEPGAQLVLEALGKKALITADFHLGEGTGAVASLPLWDMAMAVYNGCYSFTEGGIAPYTPQC